jgi:hypothetical protein
MIEFFVRSRKVGGLEIKEELRFALNLGNISDHRTRKERAKRKSKDVGNK